MLPIHRSTQADSLSRRRVGWAARVVLVLGLVSASAAWAQGVDYPNRRGYFSPGELAVMPPYCASMQGTANYEGAEGALWRSKIGTDLEHIHHYCRGLRDVWFAKLAGINPMQRRFLWERSINEYEYMVRNSKPDMPLMPEIFLRMGESYVQLGRLAEAQEWFERARTLKPDYWPAYAYWADQLVLLKQFRQARELLEQGLQNAPDTPELKTRLDKIPARGDAKK